MSKLQYEKELIRQEKLIEKINGMIPSQKQKYMTKLAVRMRLNGARIEDADNDAKKWSKKLSKEMNKKMVSAYLWLHSVGGAAGGALIGTMLDSDPVAQISSAAVMAVAGGGAGFFIGMGNGVAYEAKPLTNAVRSMKKRLAQKKAGKLRRQQEMDKMIVDNVNDQEPEQLVMEGYGD